ncbi:MAG: hypothetical protein QF898_10340 [SAR202 cluster bacterium]|nr:hypothetical protein [SAR202 cluster bacterium]
MQNPEAMIFNPDVPPDLEHAALIREEAFDWLDTNRTGVLSFTAPEVLTMAGEQHRRWLISRLRKQGIGKQREFTKRETADVLTVLFLRSKGVKFRDAVDAVVDSDLSSEDAEPRYSGVWNRLIGISLKRLRRRLTSRLLASAVFSLIRDTKDHPNSLVIVQRRDRDTTSQAPNEAVHVDHEYVFSRVLGRPSPSCWVMSPFREALFLDRDELPTRMEVTSRDFLRLDVHTHRQTYELLLGTVGPSAMTLDETALAFVGRIFDIVFLDFEEFIRAQSTRRFDAVNMPESSNADDFQLWLMTQLFEVVYPGSLCEISETSTSTSDARVLASSVDRPWEPSLWDPPKPFEMLSGYASRIGIPLVVEKVVAPWTSMIDSVGPEMRYLDSKASGASDAELARGYSALAVPIALRSVGSTGALYLLTPRIDGPQLEVEERILTVFSRIISEIIERQRAAIRTAQATAEIATVAVLSKEEFRASLLELLHREAGEVRENGQLQLDVRMPFLLISAHGPEPEEFDLTDSLRLRNWLLETLRHVEWRSFVKFHWPDPSVDMGEAGFMGEIPGVGMMIALGRPVSKNELDRIRGAFSTTLRRISPTNSPVNLVAWVLDIPVQRIAEAADNQDIQGLADDVESWASDVATVVDDVAQSQMMAHEQGEWESALRRVRRALQKEGARSNSYLRRIAADCAFALGDWPSALRYAQEGAQLSKKELGAGLVRSICQEADAKLCLGDPVGAWDGYSEASSAATNHPLPRYYRGQALLIMARLLRVYEDERQRSGGLDPAEIEQIDTVLNTLVSGAMDDLTSAADLLDRWGLLPEFSQYKNFHLVPTLLGQGTSYLLTRSPGPAASRLQSARRDFPRDDLFFREFIFAKCWEQGLHRQYGEMLLGDGWNSLRDRLQSEFGEPQAW